MNLSDNQKEVIKAARNGATVSITGCQDVFCPFEQFQELKNYGLLEPIEENVGSGYGGVLLQLTELGKTIPI